ncbi:MAG: M67 family metallopeptidase [Planctomycetota bacterium]
MDLMKDQFRFSFELLGEESRILGTIPLPSSALAPARECVALAASRRSPARRWFAAQEVAVNPVWCVDSDAYVRALRAVVPTASNSEWAHGEPATVQQDLPIDFLRDVAVRVARQSGIDSSDFKSYRLLAEPIVEPAPSGFVVTHLEPDIEVGTAPFAELARHAVTVNGVDDRDPCVIVPRPVLDSCSALTVSAGDNETGGALLGYVTRDMASGDLFIQVTDQLPAEHAEGRQTRFTFTTDSWASIRRQIAQRKRHELLVGWWHSHPVRSWCRTSGRSQRDQGDFELMNVFSRTDVEAHAQICPQAWGIALLMSNSMDGVEPSMFGWRDACVQSRGFHVLPQ